MLKVALTGGIATGKSYCLARFAAAGIPVLDADRLARDALRPGSPALAVVVDRFGPEVLAQGGELDRSRLAAIVFADAGARRDLETIVHPEIQVRIQSWIDEMEARGRHRIAMADVPLLYEAGLDDQFDRVVVVACAPETQIGRLRDRDGLTEEDARRRLAAQHPIGEKVKRADYVITTDGTFGETDRQVEVVVQALQRDSAR